MEQFDNRLTNIWATNLENWSIVELIFFFLKHSLNLQHQTFYLWQNKQFSFDQNNLIHFKIKLRFCFHHNNLSLQFTFIKANVRRIKHFLQKALVKKRDNLHFYFYLHFHQISCCLDSLENIISFTARSGQR